MIAMIINAWRFASEVIADVRAARRDLAKQYGSIAE
jgi:hypothetical protein